MYKVFFNDRYITLADDKDIHEWENYDFIHVFRSREGISRILNIFEQTETKNLLIVSDNLDLLWMEFQQLFTLITAAGGIVENVKGEFLMIFRRGKWDLPKGKAEPGENMQETALREIREETGLHDIRIVGKLTQTYHVYHIGTEKVLKETCWYHLKHEAEETFTPEREEDIEEVRWVTKSDLPVYLANTYPNIPLVFDTMNK